MLNRFEKEERFLEREEETRKQEGRKRKKRR